MPIFDFAPTVYTLPHKFIGTERLTASGSLTIPQNAHLVLLIPDAAGARFQYAATAGTTDPLIPTEGLYLPLLDANGDQVQQLSIYIPTGVTEVNAVYFAVR